MQAELIKKSRMEKARYKELKALGLLPPEPKKRKKVPPMKPRKNKKADSKAALYKKAQQIKSKKCKDQPISKYNKAQLYNYISKNA